MHFKETVSILSLKYELNDQKWENVKVLLAYPLDPLNLVFTQLFHLVGMKYDFLGDEFSLNFLDFVVVYMQHLSLRSCIFLLTIQSSD